MFNTVPTFNLDKLENFKSTFEHVGLYVGLVIFTVAGAKVKYVYNCATSIIVRSHIMKQNADFQEGISQA